jgi:hypothetical protein
VIRLQILRHCVRQSKQWETATSRSQRCCTVPCCAVLHRQQHAVTPPRRPPSTYDARQPLSGTGHHSTATGHVWSQQQHRPAPVTSKPAQQYRRVSASARRPRSGVDCRSSVRPATARLPGAEPCCTLPSSERCGSVAHVGHDGTTSGHPQRLRQQKDSVGRALSHPIPRFQRFPLLHPITTAHRQTHHRHASVPSVAGASAAAAGGRTERQAFCG